jgi:rhamnosyl/mannosyltransferase
VQTAGAEPGFFVRILHLGKYYPPADGGMENFLGDLARTQCAMGHQVHALVHDHKPGTQAHTRFVNGVEVTRVPVALHLAYAPLAPGYALHLGRVLLSFAPDVIHVHMPNVSPFWLVPALKLQTPVIVHWHADVVPGPDDAGLKLLRPLYAVPEYLLLKKAKAVIATSPEYAASSKTLARHGAKVRVVPLGIDLSRLPKPVAAVRTPNSPPMVLSVGRCTSYKGFKYLIRSWTRVQNARLVIAGSGPLLTDLHRLVHELGLEDRVSLPGFVPADELANLFAACDIFCLPSIERTEAFGLVLLEAMRYEKPLITTHVPGSGMSFVNQEQKTGLAVLPRNPEALAEAVRILLRDDQKRRHMGEQARIRLEKHFTITGVAEKIQAVYFSLLKTTNR